MSSGKISVPPKLFHPIRICLYSTLPTIRAPDQSSDILAEFVPVSMVAQSETDRDNPDVITIFVFPLCEADTYVTQDLDLIKNGVGIKKYLQPTTTFVRFILALLVRHWFSKEITRSYIFRRHLESNLVHQNISYFDVLGSYMFPLVCTCMCIRNSHVFFR